MSLVREINAASIEYFSKPAHTGSFKDPQLRALEDAFGARAVAEAFRQWAAATSSSPPDYPLSMFLAQASELLTRQSSAQAAEAAASVGENLEDLAVDLHEIAGQPFTSKQMVLLAGLGFSAAELKSAWKAFTEGRDEFQLRRANRDFLDGGAAVTVRVGRMRQQAAAKLQQQIESEKVKAAEEAKAEVVEDLGVQGLGTGDSGFGN